FRTGDFSLKDAPRSDQPQEINIDQEKSVIDTNPRYTTRVIVEILKTSKSSVENRLHQPGCVI
ncbi:hypothetical protein WH47_04551, partial [Habropoda laboriosa]